jgi:hypothetical protein
MFHDAKTLLMLPSVVKIRSDCALSHKSDPWFELGLPLFTPSALLTTIFTTRVYELMSERGRTNLPEGLRSYGRDLAVVLRI